MKYLFLLVSTLMFSQTENKIQFNYLSCGGGIYQQQKFKSKGITGNIDLSVKYKKNLVILYLACGFGGNDNNSIFIFCDLNAYYEANLLYGREFAINDWFKLEGQIGVGTFSQDNFIFGENKNSIGFPIRAKFLLYPIKKFGIGFNPNHNINCINNITTYNIILQFKF